ncbi:MAG: hypothetical protein GX760_01695, partial [Erysipelothrix sp.]|nr:hypothetical protein [Erysipelothrix sp.]
MGQSRTEYIVSRILSIVMIAVLVSVIVTPISYIFADLGEFKTDPEIITIFMGDY